MTMVTEGSLLLLEDNPGDALLFKEVMLDTELRSHSVAVVDRLSEALKLLNQRSFMLVIADLNVVDSSGLATLEALADFSSVAPIVVATGFDDLELALLAVQRGAQDYLIKSQLQPHTLERALRAAIERHTLTRDLRRAEAEYRSLFDGMRVGVFQTTPDGSVHLLNPAMKQILGLRMDASTQDLDIRTFWASPEHRESYVDKLMRIGSVSRFEAQISAFDGRIVDVELDAHIVRNIDGSDMIEGLCIDVTDRKAAERLASATHRQLEILSTINELALSSLDVETVFRRCSRFIAQALGASYVEIWERDEVSSNLRLVVTTDPPIAVFPHGHLLPLGQGYPGLAAAAASPIVTRNLGRESRFIRRDLWQRRGINSVGAFPLIGPDAEVHGVLLVGFGQTEESEVDTDDPWSFLERISYPLGNAAHNSHLYRLAGRVEALEELARLKDEFVSLASHELRTPLTGLLGYLELAVQPNASAERRSEMTMRAKVQGDRLATLVERLLDVSRLESGRTELVRKPVDLVGLISERVPFWTAFSHVHRIRVAASQASVMLECDEGLIGQALDNLVSNAIKYSPDGKEVQLSINADDRAVTIVVEDQGVGIPASDINRVFEKFYRVQGHGEIARGTGLGLAMVKAIIEMHGGTITVASQEGQGSRFTVKFPTTQSG